jgi:hypothetical protein
MLRGWAWLMVAVLIALAIGSEYGAWTFAQAWLVGAAKASTGAWIGYWASKSLCHIDPSEEPDGLTRVEAKKARAICIAGFAMALCM